MYFDVQSDLLVDSPHSKNTVVNDSAIILLTLHNTTTSMSWSISVIFTQKLSTGSIVLKKKTINFILNLNEARISYYVIEVFF